MHALENAQLEVDGRPEPGPLAGTPWSVRLSRASAGRAALEVYAAGQVVDVVVPTPLVPGTLRGARCAAGADGARHTLAWGVLEDGRGAPPEVVFARRRLRGPVRRAGESVLVGGRFWLAVAPGRYSRVTAVRGDGGTEHRSV